MKPISRVAVVALMMTIILGGPMTVWSMDPSSEAEAALLYMREEEKLARDVYLALYALWGQAIFETIADSEQQHMDAVKNLLDRYNLPDPAENKGPGDFESPEIQVLYDRLVADGRLSAVEALRVGATIEDLDIFDLRDWLEKVDQKDITQVFDNLMKGSRNHLRSFVLHLGALGESYEAQYLTQDEIDLIVSSPRERGR